MSNMPARLKRIITKPASVYYTNKLSPIARRVRRERLTYLSPVKFVQLERALDEVTNRQVEGDMLEFGVALGGSGIAIATRAGGRRFHGFDLFGQIPAPTSPKDDAVARSRYEVIASGASQGLGGDTYYGYVPDLLGKVTASFAEHGVPVDGATVCLHKGLFDDTWPDVADEITAVAVAHIDCDWYDPVKYCLDSVAPLVSPGGIIVLDDYLDYGGCRTATDEFLGEHPEFVVRHKQGNVSLKRQ